MELLPLIWAGIIAFVIVMYVILDGYSLGIGMMLPFLKTKQRDIAMSVLLPTWDGNQTWLVLGGASLYGAFPLAFSALLPTLYIPIFIMVIALLFRGVVFEFRLKSKARGQATWDAIFGLASLLVTTCQGLVLGNFVKGFQYNEQSLQLSDSSLITLFVLCAAFGLICGYILLGSTRLILKTTGVLQDKMFWVARLVAVLAVIGLVIISVWTPLSNQLVYQRWFMADHWLYLMILPICSAIALAVLFYSIWRRSDVLPYWSTIAVFLSGYIGFVISLYPYIIPYKITVWQAASPTNTLKFLLVGAVVMLPILLIYTGYSYYIFKGKVTDAISYE